MSTVEVQLAKYNGEGGASRLLAQLVRGGLDLDAVDVAAALVEVRLHDRGPPARGHDLDP